MRTQFKDPSIRARRDERRRQLLRFDGPDPLRLIVGLPRDEARINALRCGAYATAGYFSVPDERLLHRERDPADAVCLLIANKASTAATVRLCVARERKRAEAILQGPTPLADSYFPTVTLCRGATDPAFRGVGLMPLLVAIGVSVARRLGAASATGMQAEGTPHYESMLASGWLSRDVPAANTECIRIDSPRMKLLYIDAARFELSEHHSDAIDGTLRRDLRAAQAIADAAHSLEPALMGMPFAA